MSGIGGCCHLVDGLPAPAGEWTPRNSGKQGGKHSTLTHKSHSPPLTPPIHTPTATPRHPDIHSHLSLAYSLAPSLCARLRVYMPCRAFADFLPICNDQDYADSDESLLDYLRYVVIEVVVPCTTARVVRWMDSILTVLPVSTPA